MLPARPTPAPHRQQPAPQHHHPAPPPAYSSSSLDPTTDHQPPPSAPPRLRDVQDLAAPQCWICYESTTDRPFVHACSCTLVAHDDCLLAWVTTDQANKQRPSACPVCATPYTIRESRAPLLRRYRRVVRWWDRTSMGLAVMGAVGGGYMVAAGYGAWTIRTFAGDQVARALLLRHEHMPLRYWLNLPLIPFTLILSRTSLLDSLLPFLPLTLVLSASTRPSLHDPVGLDNLTLSTYPPSPTLTLCLLPWARLLYLRARQSVFAAVLGRSRAPTEGIAGLVASMRAADEGDFELPLDPVEVVAEVEFQDHLAPNGAVDNAPAQVQNRLRIGLGRLASLVVGALLFPALSACAGAGLFYLAARGGTSPSPVIKLLRRILGLQVLLATAGKPARAGSWLATLLSPTTSAVVDPLWIRNTIGGGLVLLARDAIELTAGVLERQRRESRRIVGRAFAPNLELDEVVASTSRQDLGNSGGVNEAGRRAVVHNLL